MKNSVMRLMLLPFFHDNREQEVVDPSGLGGDDGQISFHEIPVWEGYGTDEMRLKRVNPSVAPAQHRPTLDGRVASPLLFRRELEEGFVSLYQLLLSHRGELLAEGSPLFRFANVDIRIVFRPSQFYAYILTESIHPDLLRDAVDRDRHFDRLWYGIDRSTLADVALRLLPVEQEDLWRGDIPCFTAGGDSLDVRVSTGAILPGLLARSGVDMVAARLRDLGEEDLRKQLWYIRSSLAALAIELQSTSCVEPAPPVSASDVGSSPLAMAEAVSIRLHELALRCEGRAAWLGLAKTRSRGWWLRPLDADLYSGLPGIALYLAHAGEILQRREDSLLARQSLAELDRQLKQRDRLPFVGGFDGWGGLVYTWLRLGLLWGDESLVQKAVRAVPKIAELLVEDRDLDLIRGAAGGIVPLLALHRLAGDRSALELAQLMGDRLVAAAQPFKAGVCWRTASFPIHPLTGFSHGTSGFAWALLELFGATGEARYREVAARALAFEQEFFSEAEWNWMDLRPIRKEIGTADYPREAVYSISWCHGAAGIGLSRLRMMRHLDSPELLRDLRVAAETTLRQGFGVNHCLCHGDLGNLELLTQVAPVLREPSWREACAQKSRQILSDIGRRGFRCGVPFYVETPGFMEGLAGIGYGLLRLAEPGRVPCSLLLDLS
jgi:type 2 lantibiotic biosynthesis protein LanM